MKVPGRIPNLDGWPLPDEYLIELGRLAAIWTSLENQLVFALSRLLGFDASDPRWFIVLTHSSFPQKLDMLEALARPSFFNPKEPKGLKETLGALRGAQKLRNRFMHNAINFDENEKLMYLLLGSARGVLKTHREPVSPDDIRRATIAVNSAMRALHALITGEDLPPLSGQK